MKLVDLYQRMLDRYGQQNWWPGDTRFEIMVGAILTQSVNWENVERSITRLKVAGVLSPKAIREITQDQLANLVFSSGYYNVKARKLKALARFLGRQFNDDVDSMVAENISDLRSALLGIYGVGEETADSILLYALSKPSFVVDVFTKRVLSRLGIGPVMGSYEDYRRYFMDSLCHDVVLFGEYHALIVQHSKTVCRKVPLCAKCVLLDHCLTGQNNLNSPYK